MGQGKPQLKFKRNPYNNFRDNRCHRRTTGWRTTDEFWFHELCWHSQAELKMRIRKESRVKGDPPLFTHGPPPPLRDWPKQSKEHSCTSSGSTYVCVACTAKQERNREGVLSMSRTMHWSAFSLWCLFWASRPHSAVTQEVDAAKFQLEKGVRYDCGVLATSRARNRIQCAAECGKVKSCAGFNFGDSQCELLSTEASCRECRTEVPGWSHGYLPSTGQFLHALHPHHIKYFSLQPV